MTDEKTFTMGEVSTLISSLANAFLSGSESGGVLIKTSTSKKGEVNVEVRSHVATGRTLSEASADAQKVFDDLCDKYDIETSATPAREALSSESMASGYVPDFAKDA